MAGLLAGIGSRGRSLTRVVSNIKGYTNAVKSRMDRIDKNMQSAFLAIARDWEREWKQRTPKVTGQLARTEQSRVVGSNFKYESQVGSADPRSLWLEFGTRPHAIVPKKAKRLAFWTQGGFVVAKRINHPGIRVGTPESPRKGWIRQTQRNDKRGRPRFIRAGARESMPSMRPAWLAIRRKSLARLRQAIVSGKATS